MINIPWETDLKQGKELHPECTAGHLPGFNYGVFRSMVLNITSDSEEGRECGKGFLLPPALGPEEGRAMSPCAAARLPEAHVLGLCLGPGAIWA